jgi:hypothetical protein
VSSSWIEGAAPTRKQLAAFGATMAGALAVLAALRVWRSGFDGLAVAALVAGALFVLAGLLAPRPLAPVFRGWMRLAEVLGWINTRILLTVIFYLVVTPIGLVMRLARRSPLDLRQRESYWAEPPRSSYGDRHFEKQF